MQLKLPIFPSETIFLSDCVGIYTIDGIVQYIINGLPAYSHATEDLNGFKFITCTLIKQHLCSQAEIERGFNITEGFVQRYYKKFVKHGAQAFYAEKHTKGTPHKIVGEKQERIQLKLNKGQSVNSIAKQEKVAESAIRYQIKQGYLKKKV
jgi:hypothetical protein